MSGVDNSLIAAHVRRKWLWRIGAVAAVLAVLAGVLAYQVYAERVLYDAKLYVAHLASRLSANEDRARAMGAVILLGRTPSPVARLVEGGPIGADYGRAQSIFTRLISEFDLDEIFVLDRSGKLVALTQRSGSSRQETAEIGVDLSFRPYFFEAMQGRPSTYIAMGSVTGVRGFYMAAPIAVSDAASPQGVIVAKMDFREIDAILVAEDTPLAVFTPEGLVFASNQPDWLFRRDPRSDPARISHSTRLAGRFKHRQSELLNISPRGYLQDHMRQGQEVRAELPWNDASGRWVLRGFVRTLSLTGFGIALFVGGATFLTLFLFGAWIQANRALELYAGMLEKKNSRLAELTHTDALTGVGNRRLFDKALQEEWSRARRAGQQLSLLMIDVDLFKKYNDQYGHHAGDECLRAVAGAINAQARRPSDRVCRYGGEEFALILPDPTGRSGWTLAESVRAAVEALDMTHGASPHGVVTVSIGVASIVPDENNAPQFLFEESDRALYRAKLNGRNRVEGAEVLDGA
jgi:diguanylate cyclase (GGDEF)-like protein